jgi:hypothetical protein
MSQLQHALQSGSAEGSGTPTLGADGLVLEGVVTTLDGDGSPHLAPMGPIVDAEVNCLCLRPFTTSATFANLKRSGCGVFHVTDDVELLARAAVAQLTALPRLLPAAAIPGVIVADACRWYAFQVESLDDSRERAEVTARVVDRGAIREFVGFNRAKHAVVEAAILASRVKILPPQELSSEFARLAPLVQKTGAAAERRAFEFLRQVVQEAVAGGPSR